MSEHIKPTWLFESDTWGEQIAQFVEEVNRQGMRSVYAATVPMRSNETFVDLFPPKACVIFYGSLGFSRQIRTETTWVPGTFHKAHNFLCSTYYPYFHRHLLATSGNYRFTTFGKVREYKDFLFSQAGSGIDNTLFLRPNDGDKVFTGQLIEKENFDKQIGNLGHDVISDEEIVVVSEPRNIDVEWRFVVADDQVVAGSRYLPMRLRMSDSTEDRMAQHFAQTAVNGTNWRPDRIWCLDVCRTVSGNYYVIELNSFSCSGFYACNPKPIVEHASRIALQEWKRHHGL